MLQSGQPQGLKDRASVRFIHTLSCGQGLHSAVDALYKGGIYPDVIGVKFPGRGRAKRLA
jgi:hypothetical protein